MNFLWRVLPGLFFVLIAACTPTTGSENLIWRLNNRGPVPLSSDNPFLAANLFVSRLAEQNQTIYGFIQYRGIPPAVEVVSSYFSDPLIHFYYPEKREFFILEQFEAGWVINGPERIPPDTQSQVAALTRSLRAEPVLRVQKHPELLLGAGATDRVFARAGDPVQQESNAWSDPSLGIQEPRVLGGTRARETVAIPSSSTKGDFSEERIQEAVNRLQENPSGQGAELTPQGDLVHYVGYSGETLSIIARWYTHDRGNVGRLARINSLKNPDRLDIGDAIIIPAYLLRTKSPFSETDLQAMKALAVQ